MQADRQHQLEYNLQVLKRRDAAITRIMNMAGHVVLYLFNEDTKAWDRKGVEGSLFVVERSTDPSHQFVVLNRLSSENLVETVDASFQVELTEQFLLYRNTKQEILGVWFYSADERTAISELLTSLTSSADADATTAAPEPAHDTEEITPPPTAPDGGAPTSNVAQFFNMVQMSHDAPPMPVGAAVAADATSAPPPAAAEPSAAKATPAPAPPAPTPSANAKPTPPNAPPATLARPQVDLETVKKKLAAQLRSLLDDDQFLTLLANEYLRQQQRALAQAQQQRQQRSSRSAAATNSGATSGTAPAAPEGNGGGLPAQLAGLLQQQASM